MAEAFIIDALRTPTGRRQGKLSEVHPVDLGAHVLRALVDRNQIPADEYEDVIFGCLEQVGPQADDIARTCWLAAGLPMVVPGVTVDRQCGSSQQAVHFAAQAVMSGVMDLVIAGGVQSMSRIPLLAAQEAGARFGFDDPYAGSVGWTARFSGEVVSQFRGAQAIADRWHISREQMEAFALESHRRALQAIAEDRFAREITPVRGVSVDETPRQTTLEKMAQLKPVMDTRTITAALSSQIGDAASAVLIASEAALKRHQLTPRARIRQLTVLGDDPIIMLTAPIPATRRALSRAGLTQDQIDVAEVNEAFAPVPMAWMREIGFPHEKLNVNGGAIALGHPLGATGTKLLATLLCELERTQKRYGLLTMCEGGGQANVTIIERP